MPEAKFRRMQKLTIQVWLLRALTVGVRNRLVSTTAIDFVTDHRMFHPCQMDANLMRAARLQFHVQQRKSLERFVRTR